MGIRYGQCIECGNQTTSGTRGAIPKQCHQCKAPKEPGRAPRPKRRIKPTARSCDMTECSNVIVRYRSTGKVAGYWCTQKCFNVAKFRHRSGRPGPAKCRDCGTRLWTATQGRRFCTKCAEKRVYQPKGPFITTCITCGDIFESRQSFTKYCAETCRRRRTGPRYVLSGRPWNKLRDQILARSSHCALCHSPVDKSLSGMHLEGPNIDHIIPVSKGGAKYDIANLQLTHRRCNLIKGDRTPRGMQISTD